MSPVEAILRAVTRLGKILAIVLAVAWVPMTSHCLLEAAGVVPDFFCCADACPQGDSGSSGDNDSCATVESASYKIEDNPIADIVPVLALMFQVLVPFDDTPTQSNFSIDPLSTAALELRVTWQFSFRAASPPRAPSFVS